MLKQLKLNETGRDFVVGDIHGCLDLLNALLDHVSFNKEKDRLISVGDLADRGPNSLEVLRLVNEPWFHVVKGNHEQILVDYVAGGMYGFLFERNGGSWFKQLSGEEQEEVGQLAIHLLDQLPLMLTVELPDNKRFHVMHAEFQPIDVTTDGDILADFEDLYKTPCMDGWVGLWGRSHFMTLCTKGLDDRQLRKVRKGADLQKAADWMKTPHLSNIYVGHTPVDKPVRFGKLINIDTYAYGSYKPGNTDKNYGLTMCEPLTQTYWKSQKTGVTQVALVEVPDEI